MANPTVKKGFAPLANEMAEKFSEQRMSPVAYQVLFRMIRLTWGWAEGSNPKDRRKYWNGSIGELADMIGRDRGEVGRAVRAMVKVKLLRRGQEGLGIQSDYDLWGGEIEPSEVRTLSPHEDAQSSPQLRTTSPQSEDNQSSEKGLPVLKVRTNSPHSTVELKKENKETKRERGQPTPKLGFLPNGQTDTCRNRAKFVDDLRDLDVWIIGRHYHPADAPDYERANFRVQDGAVKIFEDCMATTADPSYQMRLAAHLAIHGYDIAKAPVPQ